MRIPAAASVLLLAWFGLPAAAEPIPDDIGHRVAEGFAQHAAANFATAANGTVGLMEALCAQPGDAALDAARGGFSDLVAAWGRISVLRFGPLQAQNRFERAFFWPDPRGVIVRQVQALLASGDEDALAPEGLASKSVAVQGLPALEFVLHGAGAEELATPQASYRCRYGTAIAANVAALADAVATEWEDGAPFYRTFTEPSANSALYRSGREIGGEVVKALGTALQFVRNAELLPALGETAEKARGRRAPLWRSDLSFALVAAQLDGVADLLTAAGFDADETARPVVGAILFDLSHAGEAMAAIALPAEDAFADEADRDRIRYVTVALDGANATLGERLSAALGLTMGFNALDGD